MCAPRQGWTTATGHGKLETSLLCGYLLKGCQTERPDRSNGPGTDTFPPSTKNFISGSVDD